MREKTQPLDSKLIVKGIWFVFVVHRKAPNAAPPSCRPLGLPIIDLWARAADLEHM
jgi:hypothetical protein